MKLKDKLGLSFQNTRALHQIVDDIPDRAGQWTTMSLTFKDRPLEKHTIRYRNVVEAIECLWGDPALSKYMVYAPKKIFSDANQDNRIYNEMWTGSWWHVIQVSICYPVPDTNVLTQMAFCCLETASTWCNTGPPYRRNGQDPTYPVLRWEICLPCLPHFRKFTEGDQMKTIPPCMCPYRLPFSG